MKGAIVGLGCWGAILAFVVYHAVQGYRIDKRNSHRRREAHRARVREYEFLTTHERVRYPLRSVQDRMGPRRRPSFYTCQRIWEATMAQEQRDREEWKRAAQ